MRRFALTGDDPNDRRTQGALADGTCMVPLSTRSHRRRGARERVLDAVAHHRLHVECDALATRVVLDRDKRAVAVEYLKGQDLYRASPRAGDEAGVPRTVRAKREVILSGGAFNSPQLLMLSGIGPPEALAAVGITTEVPLPGVGRNLQDRYEIGVVHKAARPWACLADARYAPDDEVAGAWRQGRGMYISNGAAAAGITRSAPHKPEPDLFVMALLTRFYGYFPGYSDVIHQSRDDLTFAVLKGHTKNRGGVISLRSRDPRDPPNIDFRYFEEGSDVGGDDLAAVVKGIRYVRRTALRLQEAGLIRAEDLPGAAIETDEQLAEYVREHAWGHHASCTCAIGRGEAGGVLSSDFRVHGTQALRVVDASVFPRIPGFFIVSAVYVIAEKAAEVILASARGQPLDSPTPLAREGTRRVIFG
jgi:choline dehydrogenase-like flavoprotein